VVTGYFSRIIISCVYLLAHDGFQVRQVVNPGHFWHGQWIIQTLHYLSHSAEIYTLSDQFVLTMIALMHPPSRSYIDPWTGQIFGDGGIDYYLHPKLIPDPLVGGVKGGVIMSKLGNETAKYAKNTSPFSVDLALDLLFERAELGRATWKLM